jgi:hypothetical protein
MKQLLFLLRLYNFPGVDESQAPGLSSAMVEEVMSSYHCMRAVIEPCLLSSSLCGFVSIDKEK